MIIFLLIPAIVIAVYYFFVMRPVSREKYKEIWPYDVRKHL